MNFWEIVCHNLIATGMGLIFTVYVVILLKNVTLQKKGFKFWSFSLLYMIFIAVSATWIYKAGLNHAILPYLLLTYFNLAGNAFVVKLFFREKSHVCWDASFFTGMIVEFAQSVSFNLSSKDMFFMSVADDRAQYLFFNLVLTPIICILLLFILHKLKIVRVYTQMTEHKDIWTGGTVCLSAYPALDPLLQMLLIHTWMLPTKSTLFTFFMLIAVLIIFYYIGMKELQRREFTAQRLILQQQNVYIETLEGMQEEMRRFRHDYKNMMAGMSLQAKEGNLAEISDFIQEMTDDFDSQIGGQIKRMSQLRNIYMTEVKGLLLTKLKEMQKDGISCELEVMYPFYGTRLKATDLCRCLGILLDNAMEEVKGKEGAQIHIMISTQEEYTTFRVKNPLYHTVDFHKIWQQGYSTKGADRGVGLASYRKILSGYDHVLPVTAIQEGYFIQELKIQEENAN